MGFRQLFCHHRYYKVGFRQEEANGVRFPVRRYRCEKCGKERLVDGRCDPFVRMAVRRR